MVDFVTHLWASWLLIFGFLARASAAATGGGLESCDFQTVYNFGDSNSDTGGISAAFTEIQPPNGETFFGNHSGRFCDGRLIIDFIAEYLGLPYLSAYLNSIGTDFRHGANFATGGSSIRPPGYSPFHLGIQISQFVQFKSRTTDLYHKVSNQRNGGEFISKLPRPSDFFKALYTIDIGQNDLAYGFQHTNEEQVRKSIPDILDQFSSAISTLYSEGARAFWIHNTGPIGCLPYSVISHSKRGDLDQNGCVRSQNEVAQEFNRQLKDRASQLRRQYPDAAFTYVDLYKAKYAIISARKQLGFHDPMKFCCGSYYGYHIDCGKKAVVNGTVYGNPCPDPEKRISWDGIHYSEAANLHVAAHIFNGTLSDPPIPPRYACHK